MKSPLTLIACLLIALVSPSFAEAIPPTFRVSAEWVIISSHEKYDQLGTFPETSAIKKNLITSMVIVGDTRDMYPSGGATPKNYSDAPREEIQALSALIVITTTEMISGGQNKQYVIRGFTHSSAPEFLDKLVQAIDGAADSGKK